MIRRRSSHLDLLRPMMVWPTKVANVKCRNLTLLSGMAINSCRRDGRDYSDIGPKGYSLGPRVTNPTREPAQSVPVCLTPRCRLRSRQCSMSSHVCCVRLAGIPTIRAVGVRYPPSCYFLRERFQRAGKLSLEIVYQTVGEAITGYNKV